MAKGRPFFELLTSALRGDYRFPILELFAFLFALATFVFGAVLVAPGGASAEVTAYSFASSLMGLPSFVFVILILKNIAYGLGSDIEKGVIQTLLSYPIKRRSILTAKLLSGIGLALLVYLSLQIYAMYLVAQEIVGPYLTTVLVTYAANLSFIFLLAGVVLTVTLLLKKGGTALIVGVVLFFASGIAGGLVTVISDGVDSPLPLQAYSVITPSLALQNYYSALSSPSAAESTLWAPTFPEVLAYVLSGWVVVILVFAVSYLYFDRRFGV